MTDNKPSDEARSDVVYNTQPSLGKRTVDRPDDKRAPTPEALAVLHQFVNYTDSEGNAVSGDMPAPHVGERFSQRQAARKVLAGRSYQAVQSWLTGDPIPAVSADWLLNDLQRIDARAEDRMMRVAADEIAIVVKR